MVISDRYLGATQMRLLIAYLGATQMRLLIASASPSSRVFICWIKPNLGNELK